MHHESLSEEAHGPVPLWFKCHSWTLTYVNTRIEGVYQHQLGDRSIPQFRGTYVFTFFMVLFKVVLLAIDLSQQSGLGSGLKSALMVTSSDVIGRLITLVICCGVLLFVLGMTLRRGWFCQFHNHINLILFLLIGLVCAILPNIGDAAIKNFVVVAEVYLLFPFALALKIGFPRCVVGGWTVALLFFVLRFATTQGSAKNVETAEIVSVAVYLVLGMVAFNYLAFVQDSADRVRFQCQHGRTADESVAMEATLVATEEP